MKRANVDVVGRPRSGDASRDVAGVAIPANARDVASFKHAIKNSLHHTLDDPMGTAIADEDLMADFEDFMSGELSSLNGELQPPDPVFRERLRRRLWRTHVMAHLRDGGETH